MLKTLSTKSTKSRKNIDGVDGGGKNKAEPVHKHKIDKDEVNSVEVDNEVDDEVEKNQKTSKSKKSSKFKKIVRSLNFFTLGAKLAFTKLR